MRGAAAQGEFQRRVRMQHALGPPRRPRGVEHHFHSERIDIDRLERTAPPFFEKARKIVSALAAHRESEFERGQFGQQPLRHFGKVEAAERGAGEDRPRTAIAQHLSHFGIAVDRDDRIDDQPRHGRGKVDHRSLVPIGQLEGYHIALLQPPTLQGSGERPRLVEPLAPRHAAHPVDNRDGYPPAPCLVR